LVLHAVFLYFVIDAIIITGNSCLVYLSLVAWTGQ